MIVGHNPGVHAIAAHFSKPGDTPHDFPPASLMVLNFIADWDELAQRSAQKQAFWTP